MFLTDVLIYYYAGNRLACRRRRISKGLFRESRFWLDVLFLIWIARSWDMGEKWGGCFFLPYSSNTALISNLIDKISLQIRRPDGERTSERVRNWGEGSSFRSISEQRILIKRDNSIRLKKKGGGDEQRILHTRFVFLLVLSLSYI